MNPFEGMKGLTRNPLGIIAVFLGILYGIAGLLLGADTRPLSEMNQSILTWLVFIFPFVSLGVFAWLVANHHTKLYAPRDYRTDEGFLGSFKPSTKAEVEEKLQAEAAAVEEADLMSGRDEGPAALPASPGTHPSASHVTSEAKSDYRHRLYLAELLVMDRLRAEFGPALQRHVTYAKNGLRISLDGVVVQGDDVVLIEVTAVRDRFNLAKRQKDLISRFVAVRAALPSTAKVKILLCIVWLGSKPAEPQPIIASARELLDTAGFSGTEIREFELSKLLPVTDTMAGSGSSELR
ncbi:MAG TPA: hypothetical protein VGB04_08565 [Allosphingosinicella sp.]|jgi:hypothetical protein